jgi:hypothetical protein
MNIKELLVQLDLRGYDIAKITEVIARRWHGDIFKFFEVPVIVNENGTPVKIVLAERLFRNGWRFVHETFIHEIAHLLNPFEHHGHWWRTDCLAMGGDGSRTHTLPFMRRERRPLKVVGYCQKCGDEVMAKSYGRRGYRYRHVNCGGRVEQIRSHGETPMLDTERNERIKAYLEKVASNDVRVMDVRCDKMVGRDSGSFIEELTDLEIMQELNNEKIRKPIHARIHFRKLHRIKASIERHPV